MKTEKRKAPWFRNTQEIKKFEAYKVLQKVTTFNLHQGFGVAIFSAIRYFAEKSFFPNYKNFTSNIFET